MTCLIMDKYLQKDNETIPALSGEESFRLRQTLNSLFPHNYINLYNVRKASIPGKFFNSQQQQHQWQIFSYRVATYPEDTSKEWLEASSEPSTRSQLLKLVRCFDSILKHHQAKPIGLCPIRRSIYDQCFGK